MVLRDREARLSGGGVLRQDLAGAPTARRS
jgi:hypothetical protein